MPRPPLSQQSLRSSSSRRQTFQVAIDMIEGRPTKEWHSSKACQNPVVQSSSWVKIDLNYCSAFPCFSSPKWYKHNLLLTVWFPHLGETRPSPQRRSTKSALPPPLCLARKAFQLHFHRPTAPYGCTAMNVLSTNMTKLLWSGRLSSRFLGRRNVQSSKVWTVSLDMLLHSQVSSMFPKV